MATDINPNALLEFAKAIASGGQSKSGARLATITRIDESGTAYVKLPGGEESPIATTGAAYNIGDVVSVSMFGGKLRTVDNITAPSVSERLVKAAIRPVSKAAELAKAAASEADKVATAINQHFWADDNGIHVTEAEHDATTEHNILINSLGILLRKASNYLVSITQSAIAFYDGTGNADANITAQFGSSGAQMGKASGPHITIGSAAIEFFKNASTRLTKIEQFADSGFTGAKMTLSESSNERSVVIQGGTDSYASFVNISASIDEDTANPQTCGISLLSSDGNGRQIDLYGSTYYHGLLKGDGDTSGWTPLNSVVKYRIHHGVCYVQGDSVGGGVSVGTSGTQVGTLPTGARPSIWIGGAATTKANTDGQFSISSNGVITVWNFSTSSPYWCFSTSYPV